MAAWITDRTLSDVNRVKELHDKAVSGTLAETERLEWVAGMKGALSYMDYNRIESGVAELARFVGATVSTKTTWTEEEFLTTSSASRWLSNVSSIRAKCSGPGSLPAIPSSMDNLGFQTMNDIETILSEIERIANDHLLYCDEPICGGEPYYALC